MLLCLRTMRGPRDRVGQLVHAKTRVSVAQCFGRTVGSTRVNCIAALQSGHVGASVTIDDVMGFTSLTAQTPHLS
jgi:hypothetical protein